MEQTYLISSLSVHPWISTYDLSDTTSLYLININMYCSKSILSDRVQNCIQSSLFIFFYFCFLSVKIHCSNSGGYSKCFIWVIEILSKNTCVIHHSNHSNHCCLVQHNSGKIQTNTGKEIPRIIKLSHTSNFCLELAKQCQ